MQTADIPRVAEILTFGWRCAYRGIVSDDILFNHRLVTRQTERLNKFFVESNAAHYVFDDGIIKAQLTIGACRDEDKKNAFELWGLYVEPLMKRQGIGALMAEYCEEIAIKQGFNEICLWVLKENKDARSFYKKMGYVSDGKEIFLEHIAATEVRYSKKL